MNMQYEEGRIYATNEEGVVIAEVTFPDVEAGVVDIDHTFVDDSLRGQGIADKLVTEAYSAIKDQKKKALLTCPYAVKWFDEHPEKSDIVKK